MRKDVQPFSLVELILLLEKFKALAEVDLNFWRFHHEFVHLMLLNGLFDFSGALWQHRLE